MLKIAASAAEFLNGGKFNNKDFYSDTHRDKWLEAMKILLEKIKELEND